MVLFAMARGQLAASLPASGRLGVWNLHCQRPSQAFRRGLAAGDWFSKSSEQFYTDAARSSDLSFNRSILTHRPRMRKLWVPEPYGRRPPFFLPVDNHER